MVQKTPELPVNDLSKGLLKIPNEILHAITEYLSVCDVKSLMRACKNLTPPIERDLLVQDAKTGKRALEWSLGNGHLRVAHKAVDNGADVNYHACPFSPLETLLGSKHIDIELTQKLLEHGADPNVVRKSHHSPLWLAVDKNLEAQAALLIKHGANVNFSRSDGRTPLHICRGQRSEAKFLKIRKLLIQEGARINIRDNEGNTPLHLAVIAGNVPYIDLLLMHGADSRIQNGEGNTCLMSALKTSGSFSKITTILIDHDEELINVANIKGNSPLHFAASRGMVKEMDLLLKHGAKLDAINSFNETAIFKSLQMNKLEAMRMLIRKGINTEIRNLNGENIFQLCMKQLVMTQQKKYLDILEYMLQFNHDKDTRQVFANVLVWDWGNGEAAHILQDKGIQSHRIIRLLPKVVGYDEAPVARAGNCVPFARSR